MNLPVSVPGRELFWNSEAPQIRSAEGGKQYVYGYAALFGVRSRTLYTPKGKPFVEEILPGAFDGADFSLIRCQFDHKEFVAAPPTLRYVVDARGLYYEYEHDPEDETHRTVLRRLRRNEAKGSSFIFTVLPQNIEVTSEGNIAVHRIRKVESVYDVGPVVAPAYPQTSAFVRSLDAEALIAETNINPTEAQKESGNYKKARVSVAGMEIAIENPKGTMRRGTAPDGTTWEVEMAAHYGYILGADAADSDNLDVFLSDDADTATCVFVIDQIRPDGTFDEHKCVIGPTTQDEARNLYLACYSPGWTGLGAISYVPMECFRAWAMDGKAKLQPLKYVAAEAVGSEAETAGNLLEMRSETSGIETETAGNVPEIAGNDSEISDNIPEPAGTEPEAEILEKQREARLYIAARAHYIQS